jgi:type VI secretion system secreted protein VgrG
MEQYGIYYFFEHADGKHTLVLSNTPDGELDCSPAAVTYQATIGATVLPDDVVTELTKEQEIRPGKYTMTDYNFETPSVKLSVSIDSVYPAVAGAKFELYDYPGEYQKRDEGDKLVKLRIEEEEAQRAVLDGASGCRQFSAGYRFQLSGHARADFDGAYVLTSVSHRAAERGYEAEGGRGESSYDNTFTCMPAKVPFRPMRLTPKPVVQGTQTAEVVGPKGEEIYTDKFGRVKVQFHWDREGKKDENSSCWIRVSHPWAGKGWGSVSIPRIGQEVIVDFLEGDPDQPIITRRVYNGELMPPYGLPAGGVVSGLKSNTTPGGGGSNEMSMDDTKGKEKISIHAQYDMSTTVEHIDTQAVKNNRVITVDGTHTETIAKNTTITINEALTETVKQAIDVKSTDSQIHLTAKTEIKLEVGASKLTMKADGTIKIEGVNISVNGTAVGVDGKAEVRIHGGMVKSTADSTHDIEGAAVMSNGSATNTVKGGMVMLNP